MCFVAAIGITGGFSAFEVTFGPVRGTSAGTVGCEAFGRAVLAGAADFDVGAVLTDPDPVVGAADVGAAAVDVVGTCVPADALDAIVAAGYVAVDSADGSEPDEQAVNVATTTQPAVANTRPRTQCPIGQSLQQSSESPN